MSNQHQSAQIQKCPTVPGVFAINKPYDMSSAKAVAIVKHYVRRVMGKKNVKVGHGGTLDPLATGVLVVAVGRAYTRDIEQYVRAEKEYRAVMHLGYSSTTDDAEGVKEKASGPVPAFADIVRVCEHFVGEIMQVPPIFSALKKDGECAYKKARRGENIEMTPRPVVIHDIAIESYIYPTITLSVRCGRGTYIRALARDIGEALGSAAYLESLHRTRVGIFADSDAFSLDVLENAAR